MSERYYITGCQLGMIEAFLLTEPNVRIQKIIDEIQDKQFIGNIPQDKKLTSEIIIVSKKARK